MLREFAHLNGNTARSIIRAASPVFSNVFEWAVLANNTMDVLPDLIEYIQYRGVNVDNFYQQSILAAISISHRISELGMFNERYHLLQDRIQHILVHTTILIAVAVLDFDGIARWRDDLGGLENAIIAANRAEREVEVAQEAVTRARAATPARSPVPPPSRTLNVFDTDSDSTDDSDDSGISPVAVSPPDGPGVVTRRRAQAMAAMQNGDCLRQLSNLEARTMMMEGGPIRPGENWYSHHNMHYGSAMNDITNIDERTTASYFLCPLFSRALDLATNSPFNRFFYELPANPIFNDLLHAAANELREHRFVFTVADIEPRGHITAAAQNRFMDVLDANPVTSDILMHATVVLQEWQRGRAQLDMLARRPHGLSPAVRSLRQRINSPNPPVAGALQSQVLPAAPAPASPVSPFTRLISGISSPPQRRVGEVYSFSPFPMSDFSPARPNLSSPSPARIPHPMRTPSRVPSVVPSLVPSLVPSPSPRRPQSSLFQSPVARQPPPPFFHSSCPSGCCRHAPAASPRPSARAPPFIPSPSRSVSPPPSSYHNARHIHRAMVSQYRAIRDMIESYNHMTPLFQRANHRPARVSCALCMDAYLDLVALQPCGHSFCPGDYNGFFTANQHLERPNCPMCRSECLTWQENVEIQHIDIHDSGGILCSGCNAVVRYGVLTGHHGCIHLFCGACTVAPRGVPASVLAAAHAAGRNVMDNPDFPPAPCPVCRVAEGRYFVRLTEGQALPAGVHIAVPPPGPLFPPPAPPPWE